MATPLNAAEVTEKMKIKAETLQKAAEHQKAITDTKAVLDAIAKATGLGVAVEAPGVRVPMIIFRPSDKDWSAILDIAKSATTKKNEEATEELKKLGVTVEE